MNNDRQSSAAYTRLVDQLGQIDGLRERSFYAPDFQSWHRQTSELIEKVFGKNSHPYEKFQTVLFTPLFLSCRGGETVFTEAYEQGLEEARDILASCLERSFDTSPPQTSPGKGGE